MRSEPSGKDRPCCERSCGEMPLEDIVKILQLQKNVKEKSKSLDPKYIEVWGKFLPRGSISIDPYCNHGKKGIEWEEIAKNRLANHDMYPEKVDNR